MLPSPPNSGCNGLGGSDVLMSFVLVASSTVSYAPWLFRIFAWDGFLSTSCAMQSECKMSSLDSCQVGSLAVK